ncbi:MAG: flavin reductase family protein, partial [Gemmatimonadetes bacterium]|nr:flavin reductase family protein [Gemmatimonadota bacterium]
MMDADAFRQVMGHFATGVAIVASRRENGEACGLTANAVTSVSLDPLLVSVCIDRAASSHDCVISSGRFAISVLGAEDEWLARRFSEADTSNKFEGVRLLEAVTGSPVLESALAWLDCGIWKVVEAGDHSIVVGEALEGGARWGTPLLFHRGSYVRLDAGAGGERPIRRRQEVRRATDGAPEAGGLSMSRAVRGGAAVLTPFLVGVAAAAAAQTSAALLLYMGSGFLSALSLIVAVQMVALSVGLWVGTGVPAGGLDVLRRRWLAALLAFATAAVLSGGWMMLRDLGSTGAGRALGLGLLAAWPLYAAGTLMAGLAARG